MKKALVFLSIFVFSLIALAKDGPFPIASAIGVWQSETVRGLLVKIAVTARTETTATVWVEVINPEGIVMAVGHAVHSLNENQLRVLTRDNKGGHEVIEIKAVSAKVLHEPVGSGYHLVVTIEKVGGSSGDSSLVFGRR